MNPEQIAILITEDPDLLNEYAILLLEQFKRLEPLLNKVARYSDYKSPKEILELAKAADPTSRDRKRPFKYIEWIVKQMGGKGVTPAIILPEDAEDVFLALTKFEKYKDIAKSARKSQFGSLSRTFRERMAGENLDKVAKLDPNIGAYKNIHALANDLYEFEDGLGKEWDMAKKDWVKRKEAEEKTEVKADFELLPGTEWIDQNEDYAVMKITSIPSLMKLAEGVAWCTGREAHARSYLTTPGRGHGPQYIIWVKPTCKDPVFPTSILGYDGSWPPNSEVVSGWRRMIQHSPDLVEFKNVADAQVKPPPELDDLIAPNPDVDPDRAVGYAQLMKKRWKEAEPAIMRSPLAAVRYASEVIKNRWPKAEGNIAQHPQAAADYAKKVIQGRWAPAEKYIMLEPEAIVDYLQGISIGREVERWPEAEPYLAKDTKQAVEYSRLIGDRVPNKAVEAAIAKDPEQAIEYMSAHMNKGFSGVGWTAAEEAISKDPKAALTYAVSILGVEGDKIKRWPPGEAAIKSSPGLWTLYKTVIKPDKL